MITPSPLAAVLFDMDGTLIDSYPAIAASVNHVRSLYSLPPLSVAEVNRHVGRGAGYLLEKTVGIGDPAANAAAYRQHHPTVLREGTRLLPGAHETLFALKGRGLKLGVCSNKPVAFTRELIAYLGLAAVLDVVLGPEDVARPKPAPDMLLAALAWLGVGPAQVLYIGDMTVDIQTARAAGVSVWVVATGSDTAEALDAAAPDRRMGNLAELVPLLEE
jgi:2-phosphoglycolate phosphatase